MVGINAELTFSCPNRNGLCVRAVKSSRSSPIAVRVLALRVCSTRLIVVKSTSSLKLRLSRIAIMTLLTALAGPLL